MKKVIYIIALALVCSLAITSCTKEEVKPTNTIGNNTGGTPSSDPIKD
jgi:uncharacterized lipoprotein YehR (DUF1307 family)